MNYRCVLACVCLALALPGCSKTTKDQAFPVENEVRRQIRTGMSRDEVVGLFGPPSHEEREDQNGMAALHYLAPFDSASKGVGRGYGGFQVLLKNGKVSEWLTIERDPSYSPKTK